MSQKSAVTTHDTPGSEATTVPTAISHTPSMQRMLTVSPGRISLHEGGGIRGLVGNGRRKVVSNVVLSSGREGSGPGGWGGARSGQ